MQQHVHGGQPGGAVYQLGAGNRAVGEPPPLIRRQGIAVVPLDVVERGEQEPARPAGRVGDRVVRRGLHAVDHRGGQGARGEVLPGAGLGVLGTLGQQFLVGVTLDVDARLRPLLLVDQVDDQP
ncbi:hypothetical protein GCM10027614_25280 [Micromonospora vulcania]